MSVATAGVWWPGYLNLSVHAGRSLPLTEGWSYKGTEPSNQLSAFSESSN